MKGLDEENPGIAFGDQGAKTEAGAGRGEVLVLIGSLVVWWAHMKPAEADATVRNGDMRGLE